MGRIHVRAATAALAISVLLPGIAVARPPSPTMDITACRVDASTVRVGVSWSDLPVTGGQVFVHPTPVGIPYDAVWNQKGKHGTHSEDIFVGTDIADIVIVNLYNAKVSPPSFEQRVIGGDGNFMEEIGSC